MLHLCNNCCIVNHTGSLLYHLLNLCNDLSKKRGVGTRSMVWALGTYCYQYVRLLHKLLISN